MPKFLVDVSGMALVHIQVEVEADDLVDSYEAGVQEALRRDYSDWEIVHVSDNGSLAADDSEEVI